MSNTTIINTFYRDNSNITKIKTQHRQIMASIINRIVKFKPMIKRAIVTNYTFYTAYILLRLISSPKSILS